MLRRQLNRERLLLRKYRRLNSLFRANKYKYKKHESVVIDELKFCDFCEMKGKKVLAEYDAATSFGSWAYMCRTHAAMQGVELGLGKGQKLIYTDEALAEAEDEWIGRYEK